MWVEGREPERGLGGGAACGEKRVGVQAEGEPGHPNLSKLLGSQPMTMGGAPQTSGQPAIWRRKMLCEWRRLWRR